MSKNSAWKQVLVWVALPVVCWAALLIGLWDTPRVVVGEPATETLYAEESFTVVNEVATRSARQTAADNVSPVFRRDLEIEDQVLESVRNLFGGLRAAAENPDVEYTPAPSPMLPVVPDRVGEGSEKLEGSVRVFGQVFVDVGGDGVFSSGEDVGVGDVSVTAVGGDGSVVAVLTSSDGGFFFGSVPAGLVRVTVDPTSVPDGLVGSRQDLRQRMVLEEGQDFGGLVVPLRVAVTSRPVQVAALKATGLPLSDVAVGLLVDLATEDVLRVALGKDPWLLVVEREVIAVVSQVLAEGGGVLSEDLLETRRTLRYQPRFVALSDMDTRVWQQVSLLIPEVASVLLLPNKTVDGEATALLRAERAEAVDPLTVTYEPGDVVVAKGVVVTEHSEGVLQLSGLLDTEPPRYAASAAVALLLVGFLGLGVNRFNPSLSTKDTVLLGVLIALAALAVRVGALVMESGLLWAFLVPSAVLGFTAAVLFNVRVAMLLAAASAGFSVVAFNDPGLVLFSGLVAVIPVPFVSAISARKDLRSAGLWMAGLSAVASVPVAWLFHPELVLWQVAATAAAGAAGSWLVGMSLLSVFEVLFGVTTALRLLDLTDGDQPALRLLEREAPGTYNHSLLVGTLSDTAARGIGADPLLARAAAYYHDLGRVTDPLLYSENRFGVPSDGPVDLEAASKMVDHVEAGVLLAKKFKIPGSVADAVRMSHGTSRVREGCAIRFPGPKPVSKELSVVMLAAAAEEVCRLEFLRSPFSEGRVRQLVEESVQMKVDDGQLSESLLTLRDVGKVTETLGNGLVGYYHKRIVYPNFGE